MSSINHVAYFDADFGLLVRTPMPSSLPDPGNGPYRPCAFTFTKAITLAYYLLNYSSWMAASAATLAQSPSPSPWRSGKRTPKYNGGLKAPYTLSTGARLPDPIQSFELDEDDALVLQIDSEEDAGMMWGDVGRLYWWMPKEDLRRRDFTRVQFDEHCAYTWLRWRVLPPVALRDLHAVAVGVACRHCPLPGRVMGWFGKLHAPRL